MLSCLALYCLDKTLDLPNQDWQIGPSESHLKRGNAVILDVGGDMRVMGMGALQQGLV